MKSLIVLAHPEHQSFNGAMFRTAVETLCVAFQSGTGTSNVLSVTDTRQYRPMR
jgi:putative NADPH-quinone reductase